MKWVKDAVTSQNNRSLTQAAGNSAFIGDYFQQWINPIWRSSEHLRQQEGVCVRLSQVKLQRVCVYGDEVQQCSSLMGYIAALWYRGDQLFRL